MSTVIFDLDGTLCDISHRLHHVQGENKNWDAFYKDCVNDVPKDNVIEMLCCLEEYHDIIISSGRSEDVRKETEEWLDKNNVKYNQLLMRPTKCYTPDNALKKMWLDTGKLGPKEEILFVVEDRDRMVQMWRGAGLTCLQVDQWDEEGEVSHPINKIKIAQDMGTFLERTSQVNRFAEWRKQHNEEQRLKDEINGKCVKQN